MLIHKQIPVFIVFREKKSSCFDLSFQIMENAFLLHQLITLVEIVGKKKTTNYGQSSSHACIKRFSLSFSYILCSCHRADSDRVQIHSGIEVKRVVFMCVCAHVFVSVCTCRPAKIHGYLFVYLKKTHLD